ncbi:MAG: AAA family ATPase, partial [bacterium]|nr:AAA family ATPase [bacterium]
TETHISRLWFTPDRAYKLLKPVALGFLDHSTTEARLRAVDREFELNRRLSPDVYLGTADLVEDGQVVDRMLIMRRLPTSRRLSSIVSGPGGEAALRAAAKEIAAFHAGLDPLLDPVGIGTRDGLRAQWESSFEEISPGVGSVIDAAEFDAVRGMATRFLDYRKHLFDHRREEGHIRDGHGDLTAADIFILDDGPRILDCLAFDDGLRICDVLADIAFLVMDLHRLAGAAAAEQLMSLYDEFTGEVHPASLAHHYVAYRAHIRAKIEVIRHQQGKAEAASAARSYHALTLHHLERSRIRLILMGGGPGSGKTSLSQALADATGWALLDTDELRKDLAGLGHDQHRPAEPGEGIYDAATKDRTYAALVDHAASLIEAGHNVILDAAWTSATHRRATAEMAQRLGADLSEIDCHVPPDVAIARLTARGDNTTSDATPQIVTHLNSIHDPWPTATRL